MAHPEDPDATAIFAAVGGRPSVPLPQRRPTSTSTSAAASTQTFARLPLRPRPPVPAPRPAPAAAPNRCRCGAQPMASCEECARPVCGDHSTLWRGWRVCDWDLEAARRRARTAAEEEERRSRAEAEAAKAERERLRNTVLDLSPEESLRLLYVQQPRTEQEVRSAVLVLRQVPAPRFTRLCLAVLPQVSRHIRSRRTRLWRHRGWAFAGEHFHDRSWFLTGSGTWYRSGSYGSAGAEQGYSGRKVRFDETEKRAVIYDMAWQQESTGFLP